jgi:16S rRNA (cytidine1402-2'-O)-methyltransferase
MQGKLYIVGTPIGNLGDMSPRAVDTLRTVDFIAAEDTRVTLKLLNHFDIHTPMLSAHAHNEQRRGQQIVARLLAGESCALVTDAGMPCISDPGGLVVQAAAEAGIEVVSIPGPSAVVAALSVTGLDAARFCFEGFLSTAKSPRRAHLDSLKQERRTMVFYEAPHKLRRTLDDLLETLGDRRIALCRELTKRHEEVLRMTLSEAVDYYADTAPRGEYVLVVEGAPEQMAEPMSEAAAVDYARQLLCEGMSPAEAAKRTARDTGVARGVIYRGLVDKQES